MFNAIWSYVTAAIGLASVAWLAWWAGRPNKAREGEQSDRDFFDAHGHWPDEDPSAAPAQWKPPVGIDGPPPKD